MIVTFVRDFWRTRNTRFFYAQGEDWYTSKVVLGTQLSQDVDRVSLLPWEPLFDPIHLAGTIMLLVALYSLICVVTSKPLVASFHAP